MSHQEQTNRVAVLKRLIRDYYKKKPLEQPHYLHKREIALESLEDNTYIRHLSFPYIEALYNYITSVKTPLHLYYSSAMYSVPDANRMESKIWEGSELIFDIDADKYEGCDKKLWVCPNSGDVSQGEVLTCPGGEKPVLYSPLPWSCIEKAWKETSMLVDVLKGDFGYKTIKVYFSGNRGFHVKVLDPEVLSLDREARRVIADYLSCSGLDVSRLLPSYKGKTVFSNVEYGLRRRVLSKAEERGLVKVQSIRGLKSIKVVDSTDVDSILKEVCINVDKAVTMDISRLSRFAGSLNMKAGLRVVEMDPSKDISNFNYESFSPFRGGIKVRSKLTGKLEVLGSNLSLIRGNTYRLDAHIGVLLLIKDFVVPVDISELEVQL